MDVLSLWKNYLNVRALRLLLCMSVASATVICRPAAGQATPSVDEASEGTAPYIVFVVDPDSCARCGPSEQHYKTDPLRRGQELEVYVETADGWLGIRPPEGSFCWMPGDSVELAADGSTGVIRKESAVAWIGTHLGQARRYRWQVELDHGETVSVIGTSQRKNSDGENKTWLRIVPPSGEFRWIHQDQVVETAEMLAQKIAENVEQRLDERAVSEVSVASLETIGNKPTPVDADQVDRPELDPNGSTRRSVISSTLQAADGEALPDLMPAPKLNAESDSPSKPTVNDSAFQIHSNVDPEDFKDSGAVIGSGLKEDWNNEAGRSILSESGAEDVPANGAAAAAAAIADPIRRMTDVVANFISPPRLVEIAPGSTNSFTRPASSAADRRWSVGSPQVASPPPYGTSAGVVQTGAVNGQASAGRVVTVGQITRVENAVANADVDTIGKALSRLIAEGASADEIGPVIRRATQLASSADVGQANRSRELLERAQRYYNLAIRRDGKTTIRSENIAAQIPALLPETPAVAAPLPGVQATSPAHGAQSENTVQQASWRTTQRNAPSNANTADANAPIHTPLGPVAGSATGYLVQVFSSRPNSPPFALTDDAGLTIAYVTPYPGVNLRNHLNSRIAVRGTEKMLDGMSTPHLLVDQAVRR